MRKIRVAGIFMAALVLSVVMVACQGNKTVTAIAVTANPTKMTYAVGDTFDPAGMVITATLQDGTSEAVTDYDYSPKTALQATDTKITITYKKQSTELTITVNAPKTLSSIKVKTPPAKTKYVAGEMFDPASMVINAVYSDGTETAVTDYEYAPKTALQATDTKITITYQGKEITQNIAILSSLQVRAGTAPAVAVYDKGATFDATGMIVDGVYSDGSKAEVTYDYSPKTALTGTETAIAITAHGLSASLPIKVVKSIAITTAPTGKNFAGDPFNKTGMVVTVTYSDDTTAPVTTYTCAPEGSLAATDNKVTVTYGGASVDQTIQVIAAKSITIKKAPNTLQYRPGNKFSPTGLILTVAYSDDVTIRDVAYSAANASSFSFSLTGDLTETDNSVTITYAGQTATQAIGVVNGIVFVTAPASVYYQDEKFNPAGLVIKETYSDGTESGEIAYNDENAATFTFTPGINAKLTASNNEVSITYRGHSKTQSITVYALDSITVATSFTKVRYYPGEKFNPAGLVVTATYAGAGGTKTATYGATSISDFKFSLSLTESLAATDTAVTITYGDKTALVNIQMLTGIAFKTAPKANYNEYDKFDPTAMIVTETYSTGDPVDVAYGDTTKALFVFDPTLETELTVDYNLTDIEIAYKSYTLTQPITVLGLSSFTVDLTASAAANLKTRYYDGNTFNPAGLTIMRTFVNGTTAELAYAADLGFSFSQTTLTGKDTIEITVTYKNKTAKFNVYMLKSIAVDTAPTKVAYYEGDAFAADGLIITLTYSDDAAVDVAYADVPAGFSFSLNTNLLPANNAVIITYQNETVSQALTVVALSSVAVDATASSALKLTYYAGDAFVPAGLVLTLTYTDAHTANVAYSAANASLFTFAPATLAAATEAVTITYRGKETSVAIGIFTGFSVKTLPTSSYRVDAKFDPTGLVITETYSGGFPNRDVTYGSATYTLFSFLPDLATGLTAADDHIQITYMGATANASITMIVLSSIEISAASTAQTEYYVGDTFKPAGLVITLTYSDATTATATYNVGNLGAIGLFTFAPLLTVPLTATDDKVTVTYGGKSADFDIGMFNDIEIKTSPTRLSYNENDTFSATGLVINELFSNGAKKEVAYAGNQSLFTFAPSLTTPLTGANNTVVITYKNKTVNVNIAVKVAVSFIINCAPSDTKYIAGDMFDPHTVTLTVTYTDNSTDTILDGFTYNVTGALSAANTTVNITYGNITNPLAITVRTVTAIAIDTATNNAKVDYLRGELFDPSRIIVTATLSDSTTVDVEYGSKISEWDYDIKAALTKADTTITVSYRGVTDTIAITVTIPVTGIMLDKPIASIAIGGDDLILNVIFTPEDADNKDIIWSSSKPEFATVNDGTVTAVAKGTTVITATSDYNGAIIATCEVTVTYLTEIRTAADFMQIFTPEGRSGMYFLANDIDFTTHGPILTYPVAPGEPQWNAADPATVVGKTWYIDHPSFFNGMFDGRGHALMNLEMKHSKKQVQAEYNYADNAAVKAANGGAIVNTDSAYGASIFGAIGKAGVVKNTAFINYTSNQTDGNGVTGASGQQGVIAQHNHGVIQNCYFENINITSTAGGDDFCRNGTIAAFNYNVIDGCVVASTYSTVGGGTNRVYPTVVRNRRNGITIGDISNTFVVTDGMTTTELAAYPAATYTGGRAFDQVTTTWSNTYALTKAIPARAIPGGAVYKSMTLAAGLAAIPSIFEFLDQNFWNLNTATEAQTAHYEPGIPLLKALPTMNIPVLDIEISEATLKLKQRQEAQLTVSFDPVSASYKAITWESSDPTVATVDANGLVKAVVDPLTVGSQTTCTITATSQDDPALFETCAVTVDGIIVVDSVTLDESDITLEIDIRNIGQTKRLAVTIGPEFSLQDVIWASDDSLVATVSPTGLVTAVGEGTCTITVTSQDTSGLSATCDVTVVKNNTKLKLPTDSRVGAPNNLVNARAANWEIARNRDGIDCSGTTYLNNTAVVVGIQVAVFANSATDADVRAWAADPNHAVAPLGYFWVVSNNGGKIVPSLVNPKNINALPDINSATYFAFIGGVGNMYGNPTGVGGGDGTSYNGGLRTMLHAIDDTWQSGNRTFKYTGRYVAVDSPTNIYQNGDWSGLSGAVDTAW